MEKVYVVSAKRSAVGSFLGTLKDVHPSNLGGEVVKAIIDEVKIDPQLIDEIIVGNILPAGLGQGLGRQVAIKAGIPDSVCAYSLNMACGSGMKAIINAYGNIRAGLHNLVVVGGVECMSSSPYILPKDIRNGIKMNDFKVIDHMTYDALTDAFNNIHMGITAENIAEKYEISREEQDLFAYNSQQKAITAVDSGRFIDEIVPIKVKVGREVMEFSTDEYPNRKSTLEKLSTLKPVFKNLGSVTAGNASGLNDGASFMLLASSSFVTKYGLNPIAEVIGFGQGGVDPKYMGLGPTPAIKNALNHAQLTLEDIDLIELNEAFAAQSLGVIHELSNEHGLSKEAIMEKTNVNGGAIALGHAVGASGNRIVVTLIHEMLKRESTYGLASLCIGGGMGTAIVVKRVSEKY